MSSINGELKEILPVIEKITSNGILKIFQILIGEKEEANIEKYTMLQVWGKDFESLDLEIGKNYCFYLNVYSQKPEDVWNNFAMVWKVDEFISFEEFVI